MKCFPLVALVAFMTAGLQAEDLEMQAKFVKVLVSSTGQFGICCNNDAGMKKALEKIGLSVSPASSWPGPPPRRK